MEGDRLISEVEVGSAYRFDAARSHRRADCLRIVCVLPTVNPYGGVISVINLAEQWLELGHEVVVVSLSRVGSAQLQPRFEVAYVVDWDRVPSFIAVGTDVVVATSWETVEPVLKILEANGRAVGFYFVQDFEPLLVSVEDEGRREGAFRTYDKIPNRVVKTGHLQERLAGYGYSSRKIVPGMDLDIFYPRDDVERDEHAVLAMARPGAPNDHRGFEMVVEVYRELASRRRDVVLHFFGCSEMPNLPFSFVNHGVLSPSRLAKLYSHCGVYVDLSWEHGFGRTGAEAMACGLPCVLSDSGGVNEYAADGVNALIVAPGDVEGAVRSVERLVDDSGVWKTMSRNGRESVAGFTDEKAAAQLLAMFRETLSR